MHPEAAGHIPIPNAERAVNLNYYNAGTYECLY
jgi:hypothetical protein